MDINELRNKRANLITGARGILDEADKRPDPALTAEENTRYNKLMDDAKGLQERIQRQDALETEERDLTQSQGAVTRPDPGDGAADGQRTAPRATPEYRAAFQSYLRGGRESLSALEVRALAADDDAAGGYTVPPEQFVTELLKSVDDQVFIRKLATVYQVDGAESLGIVSLDADPADADWTSELATGSEDSTMAFGKRQLTPHPLAKRIKASNKLLRQSRLNAESLVRDRLAYKFALTEEKGFLTGSGSGQPLGVFTASALGISTSRDISTGNTATSIETDGLQEAKWGLKPQYRRAAQWLFHTDALKQIAKKKDGDGQYIWQQGIQAGVPDRLLSLPYNESQHAPNTFTTGLYVGLLGDFSFYAIADSLGMTVQRLVELYAETNQVGFIGRLECDGMPVLEEAFVRVKLG
ncbi:MAG: Phage capsid family protein [Anaerolineales bacterium]|nr:Phage capsid family protein [Anaerolineales bacterium]